MDARESGPATRTAEHGHREAPETSPAEPAGAEVVTRLSPNRTLLEPPPAARGGHASVAREVLAMQSTYGNRLVQGLLTARRGLDREETPASESGTEQPKDLPTAVGYIGMNPAAWKEVAGLEKRTKDIVIASLDDPEAAKNLATPEGRVAYVMTTLGINPALSLGRFIDVWSALETADADARDQIGALMQMFQGAESGKYVLERLVMSGHSNGIELWGESEGEHKAGKILLARELENLTRLFPAAAGQVEDIMFSACFSANAIHLVARVFPNLQTAWGYAEFSPSIKSGSIGHMATWEKRTRGESEPGKRDKRGSSAIWTRDQGFVVNDPAEADYGILVSQVNRLADYVAAMRRGEDPLDQAVLRQFYVAIQQVLMHPETNDANRAAAENLMAKTLRLRYWKTVCGKFAEAHADKIKAAYAEIGLEVPKFASFSRADLLNHMAAFDGASSGKDAPAAAEFRSKQLQGLWDLDSAIVLTEWI